MFLVSYVNSKEEMAPVDYLKHERQSRRLNISSYEAKICLKIY